MYTFVCLVPSVSSLLNGTPQVQESGPPSWLTCFQSLEPCLSPRHCFTARSCDHRMNTWMDDHTHAHIKERVYGPQQSSRLEIRFSEFIYLLLCWLLHCCLGFCLVEVSGATLPVVCNLLIAVASLVVEHELRAAQASVVVTRGLRSCAPRL